MKIAVEIPRMDDFKKVNKLAKQVQELHVNWRPDLYFSVDEICVDEKNRGKGIGTALLEYAKKYGKGKDCTDMYLAVNEENENAIKVYEKFGFKVKNIAYSMQI